MGSSLGDWRRRTVGGTTSVEHNGFTGENESKSSKTLQSKVRGRIDTYLRRGPADEERAVRWKPEYYV